MKPVRCEDCGVTLADMYDFAHGGERSQIVCFACDPPRIYCPACGRNHQHPEELDMSKMGTEAIREAESRSLDNADEVRKLRAEVARLEGVIGRAARMLATCNDDLVRFAAGNTSGLAIGRAILDTQRELRDSAEAEQDAF